MRYQGKKVAAVEGSTSLDNIKAQAATCGFELDVIAFTATTMRNALLEGKVDVFTSDAWRSGPSPRGGRSRSSAIPSARRRTGSPWPRAMPLCS